MMNVAFYADANLLVAILLPGELSFNWHIGKDLAY